MKRILTSILVLIVLACGIAAAQNVPVKVLGGPPSDPVLIVEPHEIGVYNTTLDFKNGAYRVPVNTHFNLYYIWGGMLPYGSFTFQNKLFQDTFTLEKEGTDGFIASHVGEATIWVKAYDQDSDNDLLKNFYTTINIVVYKDEPLKMWFDVTGAGKNMGVILHIQNLRNAPVEYCKLKITPEGLTDGSLRFKYKAVLSYKGGQVTAETNAFHSITSVPGSGKGSEWTGKKYRKFYYDLVFWKILDLGQIGPAISDRFGNKLDNLFLTWKLKYTRNGQG